MADPLPPPFYPPSLAATDPGVPADVEVWSNLWPWDQLNAKGQPAEWLRLHPYILLTLSALTAKAPNGPAQLLADLNQRLLVSASAYQVDQFAAAAVNGQGNITPKTPALYAPGMWVLMVPAAGGNPLGLIEVRQITKVAGSTVTFYDNLRNGYAVNDLIMVVPPIGGSLEPGLSYLPRVHYSIDAVIAAGANLTIIAAGTVVGVALVELFLEQTATGTGAGDALILQDDLGTEIVPFSTEVLSHAWHPNGAVKLAVGRGLRLHNAFTAAFTVHGGLAVVYF